MLSDQVFRLCVCIFGVYFCYLFYGLYQEKIYSDDGDRPKFTYSLFVILCQSILQSILAKLCIIALKQKSANVPSKDYALISVTYIGSMFASNSALNFVNYPTQVLGKSCKMIPVMLAGTLFYRKNYTVRQYIAVLCIFAGITLFMIYGHNGSSDNEPKVEILGILFVIASLILDGFTGPMQEAVLEKYSPTAYQLMLGTNIFAILFALIGLILTETLQPALLVIFQFPKIALDILFFCVLSALGQIFIFITISHFGALTLSIITTTRKFFTILASSIFYGHTINQFQWIGVFAVFFGLSIEIFTKYEKHIQKKRKNSADQLANLNLQKT